ncbi:MAG: hypothetical protein IT442_13690 [Phycisphaeraceae bacterium]|nr:hypothetical protein [Phycisphaeraceae bacterium]
MLPVRHGACGVGGALLLVAMLTMAAPAALGQASDSTAQDVPAITAPRVDWSHAQRGLRMVEAWISHAARAATEPSTPAPADIEPMPVSDALGVRVTLRWLGRPMGVGDVVLGADDPARMLTRTVDLTLLLRQATDKALAEVQANLDDHNRQAAARAGGGDQPQPWTLANIRPLLADVQIGYQPTAVHVATSEPEGAMYHRFAPGYHGLMLSAEASKPPAEGAAAQASLVWPATALAGNIAPTSQLMGLLSSGGFGAGEVLKLVPKVGRADGPDVRRFEVVHAARSSPDQPAAVLVRGNVLLPPTSVDGPTLSGMAEAMTDHLLRRQRDDGGFVGTYLPSSDQFDSDEPTLQDDSLAAYVLARRAEYLASLEPQGPRAAEVLRAAQSAVRRLVTTLLPRDASAEPAARALLVLALLHVPDAESRKAERDQNVARLLALAGEDGQYRLSNKPDVRPLNLPTQVLIDAALTAVHRLNRDPAAAEVVRKNLVHLQEMFSPGKIVPAMPWWAMMEVDRRATGLDAGDAAATQPSGPDVDQFASLGASMLEAQVVTQPVFGPADVVGGFDPMPTGQDPSEWAPTPDWRSANVLAFLSLALRQPGVVSVDQQPRWVLGCGLAARFLGQLMFAEQSLYYIRSPQDVLGGVRPALWDNRLSTAPTAMALLAVTELQETLRALESPQPSP